MNFLALLVFRFELTTPASERKCQARESQGPPEVRSAVLEEPSSKLLFKGCSWNLHQAGDESISQGASGWALPPFARGSNWQNHQSWRRSTQMGYKVCGASKASTSQKATALSDRENVSCKDRHLKHHSNYTFSTRSHHRRIMN